MGCWIGALGRLTIIPEPTDDLIMEYADFSDHACPEDYNEDEIFKNPWYFDEENRLASCAGKFAEPPIWYRCLKKEFFAPRGYQLCGDPLFVGEEEPNFGELQESRRREWKLWQKRVDGMRESKKGLKSL